jgi:6-phosphogluconate dehydrogenase
MKPKRVEARKVLAGPESNGQVPPVSDPDALIDALESALYFAKISSYAQGMALLQAASDEYNWSLNLSEIARIWKAGCIIRARLLDEIMQAYADGKAPDNLMLDPFFTEAINAGQPEIRTALHTALDHGIPTPALSWALNYVDTYRQEFLPANLIQGQRDFFGAHTYKRLDKDGTFHTEWAEAEPSPKVESKPSNRQPWADDRGSDEGDRAKVAATVPEGSSDKVLHPEHSDEELAPEAEEKGERTPAATRKAEY